jgi:hypothetical protein
MLQLTTSDYMAICAIVSTVIFGTIAAVQTRRANRLNQLAVKAQGVFKTPTVSVRILDQNEVASFLLAAPIRTDHVFEFPLQYTIANSGDKTAEDVEIILRMPKYLCYGGSPGSFSGALFKVDCNISLENSNFQTFTYHMPTLHPKQAVIINHPLSLTHDTLLRRSVTVATKDKRHINIPYILEYAYTMDFAILQKDEPPTAATFSLRVFDTYERPLRDTLNVYNRVLMDQYRKAISRESFFARILRRRTDAEKLRVVQVDKKDVVMDSSHPIDRVVETGQLSIVEGVSLEYGFFIPALDIGWDNT